MIKSRRREPERRCRASSGPSSKASVCNFFVFVLFRYDNSIELYHHCIFRRRVWEPAVWLVNGRVRRHGNVSRILGRSSRLAQRLLGAPVVTAKSKIISYTSGTQS